MPKATLLMLVHFSTPEEAPVTLNPAQVIYEWVYYLDRKFLDGSMLNVLPC